MGREDEDEGPRDYFHMHGGAIQEAGCSGPRNSMASYSRGDPGVDDMMGESRVIGPEPGNAEM